MEKLSLTEKLMYSTVRIECKKEKGMTTGTGFVFAFKDSEGLYIPVVITNKHVVENGLEGKLIFTLADEDGNPNHNERINYEIKNFEQFWIKHPSEDVDLCVMQIGHVMNLLKKQQKKIFITPIEEHLIPEENYLENLTAIEEICMIGYPNGIWDSVNNLPIIRKGITATHPKFDYNGKEEFLIDAACFPGSSGSPVFLMNIGSYTDKNGAVHSGNRIALLGILYAGPQNTSIGEIVTIPIDYKKISVTNIPNNLGFVIKAKRISELKHIVLEKARKNEIY